MVLEPRGRPSEFTVAIPKVCSSVDLEFEHGVEVLDVHRRATDIVNDAVDSEVTYHDFCAKQDETEKEDGGWKSVGGRGDRVISDPAFDLRPIGVKSKF